MTIGALFGVTVKLLVTTIPAITVSSEGPGQFGAALEGTTSGVPTESLRVDWSVRKRIGSSADECQIQIYNLDLLARTALEAARRSGKGARALTTRVVLAIGWGGVPEPLFTGELTYAATGQQGADLVSTISALTGGVAWDTAPAGGSDFGLVASSLVFLEASLLGHPVSPAVLALVDAEASARAISVWSRPDDAGPRTMLNWIFSTLDLTWGVDANTNAIVAYKHGVRAELPAIGLSPTSGLLTWARTDDGVEFEALAQPGMVPGRLVQVFAAPFAAAPVGPVMRCEQIEFSGSSYSHSLMRGVARAVEAVT